MKRECLNKLIEMMGDNGEVIIHHQYGYELYFTLLTRKDIEILMNVTRCYNCDFNIQPNKEQSKYVVVEIVEQIAIDAGLVQY